MAQKAFISSRLAAETPAYEAFHEMSRGVDPEVLEDIGIHEPYTEMQRFDEAREVARMLLPEVRRRHLNSLSDEEIAELSGRGINQIQADGGRGHAIEEILAGKLDGYDIK